MNRLKFLFIPLLIAGFFAMSCSSDDDAGDENHVDLIVGTWKITDVWVGGQSVYAIIMMTNPCVLESKVILENDFNARVEMVESNDAGGCVAGEVQHGTWSKEGSTYYISSEGQTSSSEVEFLDDNNFTFMLEFEGQEAKLKMTRI